jgi:hypothetical protein
MRLIMALIRPLSRRLVVIVLFCVSVLSFASVSSGQQMKLKGYFASAPATDAAGNTLSMAQAAANSDLATFTYTVLSSRDGNSYSGVMVGESPFGTSFSTTTINTLVIPVILTTNSIATRVTNGTVLTTKPGVTVFDPTAADDACLNSPNDVPLTLMAQSPIFQSVPFQFGPTTIGTTQYLDAFQRANFWQFVGGTGYHTMLNPQILSPVTVNLPGNQGIAFPASLSGACGPMAVVDFDVMYRQVFGSLLASEGVNSSQFPILLFNNVVMSTSSPNDLKECCLLGFHSAITQHPGAHVQTYAFINFDTSGDFGLVPPKGTSIAAHEVGEWMDDPFGNNPTPPWGHAGQVGACQGNLEVGDPLTGTNIPTVTGANGFAYHLQELAFSSWFYGAPSIAVNGWFSDNNTFKGDAGPVCTKN